MSEVPFQPSVYMLVAAFSSSSWLHITLALVQFINIDAE